MLAKRGSTCDRCDHLIRVGDDVVRRHGKIIHARCAPGADE